VLSRTSATSACPGVVTTVQYLAPDGPVDPVLGQRAHAHQPDHHLRARFAAELVAAGLDDRQHALGHREVLHAP
jgi:hypothetical protein